MRAVGRGSFPALQVRNYRLYTSGQFVSVAGNWAYNVALGWLAFDLTGSGSLLGAIVSARYVPTVLLGAWGGLIVDRHDKRRLLLACNAGECAVSVVLGLLVATELINVPLLVAFAMSLGLLNVVSGPARQTFISELVPTDLLGNAIGINSIVMSTARIIGPAVAGVVIAEVGTAQCFWLNALSFVAAITALLRLHVTTMRPATPVVRQRGQIREGFRHVRHRRNLLVPMVMITATGTFTWVFPVTLPLLAIGTFDSGARAYGALTACLAVGAVLGGLVAARRQIVSLSTLAYACMAWGVGMLLLSAAPSLVAALATMVVVGLLATSFNSQAKTLLQITALPHFRGRVMALWVIAWQGTTLVGGPIVGAVAEHFSARWAVAVGGLAALASGAYGRAAARRTGPSQGLDSGDPALA